MDGHFKELLLMDMMCSIYSKGSNGKQHDVYNTVVFGPCECLARFILTHNNVLHISSCAWGVLPKRTKSPLLCSVMRLSSAFIMQMMAMSDADVGTDIFQTVFTYNTDMIMWGAIN